MDQIVVKVAWFIYVVGSAIMTGQKGLLDI